jgi:hypothetical protein
MKDQRTPKLVASIYEMVSTGGDECRAAELYSFMSSGYKISKIADQGQAGSTTAEQLRRGPRDACAPSHARPAPLRLNDLFELTLGQVAR